MGLFRTRGTWAKLPPAPEWPCVGGGAGAALADGVGHSAGVDAADKTVAALHEGLAVPGPGGGGSQTAEWISESGGVWCGVQWTELLVGSYQKISFNPN